MLWATEKHSGGTGDGCLSLFPDVAQRPRPQRNDLCVCVAMAPSSGGCQTGSAVSHRGRWEAVLRIFFFILFFQIVLKTMNMLKCFVKNTLCHFIFLCQIILFPKMFPCIKHLISKHVHNNSIYNRSHFFYFCVTFGLPVIRVLVLFRRPHQFFRSVQSTCTELLKVIERYQQRITRESFTAAASSCRV